MSVEDPKDPYVDLSPGNPRAIPSWRDPHLVISGPAGVLFVTPLAGFTTAGKTLSMTASADLDLAAQNALVTSAKDGIELFTVGKLAQADRPVDETGIRMVAASGPVTIQAQSDEAHLSALQNIEISSTTADVTIAAKEHVLLTALGAYLRLADGNIEIHAPGKVVFHAGQKILTGPQIEKQEMIQFPEPTGLYAEKFRFQNELGQDLTSLDHRLETPHAERTDLSSAAAQSRKAHSNAPEALKTRLDLPELNVGDDQF